MTEPIRVLFFAGARERAGVETAEFDASVIATVDDLRRQLAARFNNLAAWLPKVAFAINEVYAHDTTALKPGDTVAVIPPVSGG